MHLVLLLVVLASFGATASPEGLDLLEMGRRLFYPNLACGSTSRQRKMTFVNPARMPNECSYTVRAVNNRVCQLRLDFDMVLAQPTVTEEKNYPHCVHDLFTVNGIELCGTNFKQHMYVPFDVVKSTDTMDLKFKIADRMLNPTFSSVLWSMTVTQIECPSKSMLARFDELLAPSGCLQYFHESTGNIETFNYNSGNGPYLGNMSYAICLRRTSPKQRISLRTVSFEMSKADATKDGYDVECMPHIETASGGEDYLSIQDGIRTNGNVMRASKFCGKSLDAASLTTSSSGPFVLHFNSDKIYAATPNVVEKGFRMQYTIS